jgi:hypothetical protein
VVVAKLDRLGRRLSAKELAAADPDHDGALTRGEYFAVVEKRFKAADDTAAGRALLRLLK